MLEIQIGETLHRPLYAIVEAYDADSTDDLALIDGVNDEVIGTANRLDPGKMSTVDFLNWVVTTLARREHSEYGDNEQELGVQVTLLALADQLIAEHDGGRGASSSGIRG